MTPTRTAPTDEEMHEIIRRGKEWYENSIRAQVETENFGEYLVIDVTTGDYAMGKDPLETAHDIQAQHPDGILYGMRVGFPAFGKRGGGWKLERKGLRESSTSKRGKRASVSLCAAQKNAPLKWIS